MVWILLGVVGVLVVGGSAALLVGRVPFDPMAPAVKTTPDTGLPTGELRSGDVAMIRFDTALRGYRMDQVDEVLERLRFELRRHEEVDRERVAPVRVDGTSSADGGSMPPVLWAPAGPPPTATAPAPVSPLVEDFWQPAERED